MVERHAETIGRHAGSGPAAPTGLNLREWTAALKRSFREFLADDCPGLAQQIAFSAILAFFPTMIFAVGLLGLIGAYDDLERLLRPIAPGAVLDAIDLARDSSTRNKSSSVVAFVVGAGGALWAASGAAATTMKAVNRAYDRTETRPFWKVRLTAAVLVLLSAFAVAALFVLIVFGGPLGEAIADRAHLGGAFDLAWGIARWPVAFAAILLFFALVYYLGPDVRPRSWKWITPGSLVGGVLWLALSGLFALYTSFSSSYDKTYGSLAGAIVLLLWLNYSAYSVLYGAELNAELDRQADIRAAGGPNAGLVKQVRRGA